MKTSKGFTIVELLIVVAVIGILAAITIIGYGIVQNNSHDTALKANLNKFADAVQLKILDDEAVPPGGMTSSSVGDATILTGIDVEPNEASYDPAVANLYYCAGAIGGSDEFAFVARSVSGKVFYYLSSKGVAQLTAALTWTATASSNACIAAGFTAPFTWSYGYNPDPEFLWYDWALPVD